MLRDDLKSLPPTEKMRALWSCLQSNRSVRIYLDGHAYTFLHLNQCIANSDLGLAQVEC